MENNSFLIIKGAKHSMQRTLPNIFNFRVLAIPSGIGLSHLMRLVLVAIELKNMGAEVAFAFKDYNKILKHFGFKIFRVADVTVSDFSSNAFEAFTPDLVERCIEDELKAIHAFKADAIVGDFRHTAAISSRVAKIPYISVVNGYMTDYFNPVEAMIPKEKKPFKHTIASFAARSIQGIQKRALATHFRSVARKYGIKNLKSLYDFLIGDLTLIADLQEFCPLKKLPGNFDYIGPLIWEGFNCTVPDYIKHLNKSKRLIYATTGNTGKERLIQLVFDAFKNDPSYEVVLTTGDFLKTGKVPKISNIHTERFIPGSEVMKKCHAVIHCGGNGTTYQTLSQGVPSLVIPFNNDQKINAWLIKKNKLGIPCSPGALTGKHVKLIIEQLIQDVGIQKNLQRFKDLLKKIDGPKNAVNRIIDYFNGKEHKKGGCD